VRKRGTAISAAQFRLRMTREEIGSDLGVKLEPVSRVLSRFQDNELISVALRSLVIVDAKKLAIVVPDLGSRAVALFPFHDPLQRGAFPLGSPATEFDHG
jgi:hypothetical protein